MFIYRDNFNAYLSKNQKEERAEMRRKAEANRGGRMMMFLGGGGTEAIDASERPEFVEPVESISQVLRMSIIDFGLLSFYTIATFVGAFLAFVRYDVR